MPLPANRTVAASDLVRQFGLWRDLAAREPVYVEYRGQPRLVLASIELMGQLCAPHGSGSFDAAREAALLDTIAEPALIVDHDRTIVAVGRAARQYFGSVARAGSALTAAMFPTVATVVDTLAARVIASGVEDSLDITDPAWPDRRLELRIAPHPAGALLVGRDRAVEDERDRSRELAAAILRVVGALPGQAIARVGLRGYIAAPDPSLTRLTGFPAAALATIRFVTLFDVASRVLVGEAVEQAIDNGDGAMCHAALLTNHGGPAAVRVAITAEHRGAAVTGAFVLLSLAPPDAPAEQG